MPMLNTMLIFCCYFSDITGNTEGNVNIKENIYNIKETIILRKKKKKATITSKTQYTGFPST